MEVFVFDTYEELSRKAADDVLQYLQAIQQPLICPASGDSPAGLYKVIVEKVKRGKLDISAWQFVGLDEWAGMNGEDEGSCRFHLNNQLFHPLQIENEDICFFDGRASDMQQECDRTEDFIQHQGGIDIAIVGLGMNGHVGMNEPGTSPLSRSHVAKIDPQTQQIGQKYFSQAKKLSHGFTLGLATIMEARKIMLIVSGSKKAQIVLRLLEEEISEQLPASFLRNHSNFAVYLDKAAAQLSLSK